MNDRANDAAAGVDIAPILAGLPPAPPPPASTYRVQLHAGFTFQDVTRLVPYLADLGVTTLYASPHLKANPGSTHGYDIVDYAALNPELGTEKDYAGLISTLRSHRMGLLVDFVPNHMGIARGTNVWWQDVLENGRSSPYAEFFDIEWEPAHSSPRGKILLPFLGDHYGAVLEAGQLQLRFADGAFAVWYYEVPYPIAPPTYPLILRQPLPELESRLAPDDPDLLEYQSIITGLDRLPSQDETDPERVAERRREQTVQKRRLAELVERASEIRRALEQTIAAFNGTPGEPRSFDLLDQLLETQSYRLAYWRVAAEEINYRRFFAINELAAIRQEVPAVFDATHGLLLRLAADGAVTGIRIDHPDGLWDPAGYYRRLQQALFLARSRARAEGDLPPESEALLLASSQATAPEQRFYVVVEKILEPGEALPPAWPVAGTVGYEFARVVTDLFVDSANRKAFDEIYRRFTGEELDFQTLVYDKKRLIMRVALASEVNVLANALNRISEQNRHTRDFTLNALRFALREVIAAFPVYRTYAVCQGEPASDEDADAEAPPVISPADRRTIERAITLAKRRNPASDPTVFDFIRDVLLLRDLPGLTAEQRGERCAFGMKFQQVTGPVMAKGLEDTALYIYNRLVALNEVGGDPTAFGVSPEEFHRQCLERQRRWPYALLTSSTHDTKRSEDVRARIAVLSEAPREWRTSLTRWRRINRRHKRRIEGTSAPSANDEYLLYQTLLGTWPFDDRPPDAEYVERIVAYMLKAAREAQVQTSWINPNAEYEDALIGFVRAVLDPDTGREFQEAMAPLRRLVARVGIVNSLAAQLLKLTAPGVPDIYQGTELWDFSLVDPDNRRPVDFTLRQRLLRELRRPSRALATELLDSAEDGRIKLYVTLRALTCRRDLPDLFTEGAYLPLEMSGSHAARVVAFARRLGDPEAIVAVPRLVAGLMREGAMPLGEVWGDTRLCLPPDAAGARYQNVFTGESLVPSGDGLALRCADLFASFPVALLRRAGNEASCRVAATGVA